MAAQERRIGLGRGLSALLGEEDGALVATPLPHGYRTVPVGAVHPGRQQPRTHIDETALQELAESIREKGILQPILVRQDPDDPAAYELIAGERRWRAAQLAQLHEVPVVVKKLNDGEAMEIALIENLQRQDLSPVEEAEGYRRLMEEFNHTQQDMGRVIGKSRSHVANMLRLLELPASVKALLEGGVITAGHARALLTAPEPERLADQVVRDGLNVRQTEKLAQAANPESRVKRSGEGKAGNGEKIDSDTLSLQRDVSNLLGLKVQIHFSRGGGKLILHYDSLDQLDEILHRLSHGQHGSRQPIIDASPDTTKT
ncbi:MAG: ParB/RepB/Spo0J family partition protein [Rhodospirillales bacterium]|jgi:ParB family chromosome partitioning protein